MVGGGQHLEFDPLAGMYFQSVAFSYVRYQPDRRQIADHEDGIAGGIAGAAGDVLAWSDLPLHDRTADRGVDRSLGIDLAGSLEDGDLVIGLLQNTQAVADSLQGDLGGAQVVLGADEIGLGLLPIFQRDRLAFIEIVLALLDNLREMQLGARGFQSRYRGDEVVMRLHHVGRFEREQELALLDGVTRLRDDSRDTAGIGRKHRRRARFIDRDLAIGRYLGPKLALLDRLDGECGPLRRSRIEHAGCIPALRLFGLPLADAVVWTRFGQ